MSSKPRYNPVPQTKARLRASSEMRLLTSNNLRADAFIVVEVAELGFLWKVLRARSF